MMRTVMCGLLAATVVVTGCDDDDDPVWDSDVSALVISSTGGFTAPAEPTADCPFDGTELTLSFASKRLDAWRCQADGDGRLVKRSASRTLTQAELDALVPKLEALRLDDDSLCKGADKPTLSLALTTPSGTAEYSDGFYACSGDPNPPLESEALGAVYGALAQMAFPTAAPLQQ